MTPAERELLHTLDQMILNASDEELKKIQEVDLQTQLDGISFYDAFVNSNSMANQSIKQETRDSRK
ncbi:hypothetical protein NsoK4_02280 [Nitrosopumilus sp. K4]|uniref:hypothetical protein n=1 Tax=Nitrosopumilus sp. K4 TaxID=2795383 RepID=UPI001BABBDFB|nr:hypothetical protein [Nitrosopumilus sp. K4]QUC65113.1 hypothetical protein NsoK4_02280 [Nitrosopumilus sp. K4]